MNGNGVNGNGSAITQFGFSPPSITGMQGLPAYSPGGGLASGGDASELVEWLRMACSSGIIDAVLISRIQHGSNPVPINRLPAGALDPDEFAGRIARVCDTNAKAFGRVATYEIEACVRDASVLSGYRTVASHMLSAGGDQARSRGEVEPPNEVGFTSQIMRHKEVDQGLKDKMVIAMMDRLMLDNRELREELAHYKGVVMQTFDKMKEYTILSADEQGRMKRAEIRGEVEKHAIGELTKMIPVGMQLLATKFAASESVVFQKLKTFSESISDEQYQGIAMILKPEQSIQLLEMLGKFEEANTLRGALQVAAATPEPPKEPSKEEKK